MLRTTFALLASALMFSGSAFAADVTLKAADGTRLYADYDEVAGAETGVVLVHMLRRSSKDWRFLSEKINSSGLSTIAVDLRKHGANVPEGTKAEIADEEFALMQQDVQAAVDYLKKKGVKNIVIVGASIGANLAMNVAASDPAVTNVVLLSPGMDYKGVGVADALKAYGDRPVLIVVSQDDRYSAKTGLVLDAEARGTHLLEVYETAGHGTKMLNKAPELEPLVLSWVLGSYRMGGEVGGNMSVETGDRSSVETTGKKIGE